MAETPSRSELLERIFAEDEVDPYRQRKHDIVGMMFLGVPARTAAAWLSAVDKAQRDGRSCPSWDELEKVAPSMAVDR